MVWDKRGTRLFYGDEQGRIVIAFVPRVSRREREREREGKERRKGEGERQRQRKGRDKNYCFVYYSSLVSLAVAHYSNELTKSYTLRRCQSSSW